MPKNQRRARATANIPTEDAATAANATAAAVENTAGEWVDEHRGQLFASGAAGIAVIGAIAFLRGSRRRRWRREFDHAEMERAHRDKAQVGLEFPTDPASPPAPRRWDWNVWIRKRKERIVANAEEERARREWDGHRLSSSDEDPFKRRYHRKDPWLKKIGYFAKRKKGRPYGFCSTASGATDDRAQRNKVLALAKARKIDIILVTELTRWGRSMPELFHTLQDLQTWEVSLVAQTGV